MPSPRTPPFVDTLDALIAAVQAQTAAIASLQLDVAALKEDMTRTAQFERYMAESFYGPNPDITGMWDGTDRY